MSPVSRVQCQRFPPHTSDSFNISVRKLMVLVRVWRASAHADPTRSPSVGEHATHTTTRARVQRLFVQSLVPLTSNRELHTHACRLSNLGHQKVRSGSRGQITTSCVALCRCAFTIAYSPPQPTHTRTHVCTHFTGATVTTRTLENVSVAAISPRWQNSTRHWRQPRDRSCDRPRAWRSRGSACHLLEDRSARGGYVTQEGWVHCRLHSGPTSPRQWVTSGHGGRVTKADVATGHCCGHNLQLLPTDIQGWPRHGQCYRLCFFAYHHWGTFE
jgi:hypothetical protein